MSLSGIGAALRRDTVGGLLLIGAAAVALLWANSPWSRSYEAVRSAEFGPHALHLHLPVEAWAADGLLALFFFIVGNELKQEFVHGELRRPKRALVPIIAAVCGALVPAAIFAAINLEDPVAVRGWGIPMATDIAFAIAILAVVGRFLPPALRTFLLTLAVVDDLVAIAVIAVFYTDALSLPPALAAVALLLVFAHLQRRGFPGPLGRWRGVRWALWAVLACAIWVLVHASGIHATIAGVAMGLLMRTSTRSGEEESPSSRAEHALRPWAMGVALPVFALLSAGVAVGGWTSTLSEPVALGIIAGLVGGKLVGITGGAWLATRLTGAQLNPALRWLDIAGVSLLAGIGFTVSLLISELSYEGAPAMLEHAKSAVLLASFLATVLASVVLGARSAHYRRHGVPDETG
ncbi:Na+/H+ antiporter NhaA [Saccharopolyspora sp. CA-218241]|uniref:Na+/H+ antiporter NhaA n=1 Tax=Saccharopolyspora sp. CA-218241 TaxID=3240027 RepID=UPI003D97EAF7